MKYLLYVTLAVLLWSVECKVIRQIGNDIDKPSSNRVVHCPGGCKLPTVEPDLDNGPQTSVSHLPPSSSKNEVVDQDTEENETIEQAGQQHPKVFHDELKRNIGSLPPIGGKFISDVVNKGEDFLGVFIPKIGKRDIGSLFPVGGKFISNMVNKGEDFVGVFIPKLGKRNLRSRRRRRVSNSHRLGERFGATLLTPFM